MADSFRDYEAILIVHPDTNADAMQKLQQQFGETVSRQGGRVTETVPLGKRKMTYRIAKQGEGQYLQMRLQLPPAAVEPLRKAVGLMESVLRLMVVQGTAPAAPAARPEGETRGEP